MCTHCVGALNIVYVYTLCRGFTFQKSCRFFNRDKKKLAQLLPIVIQDSLELLEGTARYAGLPLSALAFGQGFFCPSGKKELLTLFVLMLGHFWCSVVTFVTLSSNSSNFEKNSKNPKKNPKMSKKIKKKYKISKNPKKKYNMKKSKKSNKIQKNQIFHKNPVLPKNHFFSKNLKI